MYLTATGGMCDRGLPQRIAPHCGDVPETVLRAARRFGQPTPNMLMVATVNSQHSRQYGGWGGRLELVLRAPIFGKGGGGAARLSEETAT